MPITNYDQYMKESTGKGRVSLYPEHRADTLASTKAIEWGKAVQYNATNKDRGETYDGTQKVVGVAIAQHFAQVTLNNSIIGSYAENDAVSVLRKGVIWVEVLEDVKKGDLAVADNVTGDFRPSGTAVAEVSKSIGEFKSSATAGGLAQLEINLPSVGGA